MRRLLRAASLATGLLVAAGGEDLLSEPPAERRPNVLLITLDTTRADHLGCYGMRGARTPHLDALASCGVLFEQAHTAVPLTLPAHAVILTGQLPSSLNLRVNGLRLREGVPTLATWLKARGYWTGAVVSSVILERERGLARGFDAYDDRMTMGPRGGGPPEERAAEEVTTAALEAVKKSRGPYFLWVHYYDPHYEYRPPEAFARLFPQQPYDGEIAYMDAEVGRLLKALKETGRLDDTLVVAAGDHGEGLMEHGERQHGIFLYEYAVHVPLIMAHEGRLPAGLRVRDLCGLEDLAPTVLDLVGGTPGAADGRSLRPLLERRELATKRLYLESYQGFFTYGWAPLRGIMDAEFKYIEAPRPELYRWRASEDENLYAAGRPEVAAARRELGRYEAADAGELKAIEGLLKDPSNAETLRQLQSLGYLSGGGARPDAAGLLDPKDAIGLEEELRRAKESQDLGRAKEAQEILLGVLKRNPQNVPALSMLGLLYLQAEEYEKARVCFAEEVRLKPQMETGHLNLGTAYKRLGQKALAEREYRAALALSPRMAEASASLAQLLLQDNRATDARKVLDAALGAGAESADLYFQLGVLEASGSNWEKARFAFTKCVSLDPRRDEALANLGQVAYHQGRLDEAIFQYERASRLAPRKAAYLATLGSLYLNGKNDESKALQYYQRALAAEPYGPDAAQLREVVQQLKALAPK
jgi:arylsulfatase A-like enzyme/Tfp pilus assembly protein PilF